MTRRIPAVCGVLVLLVSGAASAQTPLVDAITDGAVLLQYECSDFKGMYMAAPAWTPDTDGMAGQVLRVTFRTNTGVSSVTSLLNGVEYNKETGAGAQLSSGFFFLLFAGDRVETYVYSGATAVLPQGSWTVV